MSLLLPTHMIQSLCKTSYSLICIKMTFTSYKRIGYVTKSNGLSKPHFKSVQRYAQSIGCAQLDWHIALAHWLGPDHDEQLAVLCDGWSCISFRSDWPRVS